MNVDSALGALAALSNVKLAAIENKLALFERALSHREIAQQLGDLLDRQRDSGRSQ